MPATRTVLPVLLLLMFSSWSGAVLASNNDSESPSISIPNEAITDFQWSEISVDYESSYDLKKFSGLINSPFGDFDPLVDPIPLGPENLFDSSAIFRTGLVIIQSNGVDMTGLIDLLDLYEIPIIDSIPDSALIVRLPVDDISETKSLLEKSEHVRWINGLPIAWRVSQELVSVAGRGGIIVDLDIIPASDLEFDELLELEKNLKVLSEDEVARSICDAFLCQIKNIDASWIPVLAMDGRILSIHSSSIITIHNDNARELVGTNIALEISPGLNGSGEILAISDTGIDEDHGDFNGRIREIYNQFGPDNSYSDRNSGHGTHVTSTLLGDGAGESFTQGMVPAATFHFYQLEADSSGILARWGSLYDMFSHSYQQSARIQTNSWGNVNLIGEYSSDSRSADSYVVDQPSFLVLFSAGDLGDSGYETITPPGTAKNVLTIGSSTTGSYGSEAQGAVASTSSKGTTLDGRIKPDLVAPGVMICSARAEEALFVEGESCSTSTHEGTDIPLYMTLNGSSMSTAVAAGAATMVRQHLRETQSLAEPRSDLIKAVLINGADDIGAPDIPNSMEGWGEVNVSNSIFPNDNNEQLDLLYDNSRELRPGHSFIYNIELDSSSKFDITLVWNDREGSAVANQSSPKLVNDLNLIVTSPSGDIYYGNNFMNGFSAKDGSPDYLNNVERIRLSLPESGTWSIEVGHAGGYLQNYAIVLTGDLTETLLPDLTIIPNSLTTSVESPLQGDTFLIEAQWKNQAAGPTGDYSILIEDITDNSVILEQEKTSLSGGSISSLSYPHIFTTTGLHTIKMTLDSNSEVLELNDEVDGIDNNYVEIDVYVSQVGVRLTPLLVDGTLPSTPSEIEDSRTRSLDPTTTNSVSFQLEMRNEGTSQITVDISASPVQLLGIGGLLMSPQDEWWKLFNESGPWTLSPSGDQGDRRIISLDFSDVDSDVDDAIYALPGTFVSQVTLWDKNAPTVYHSLQLRSVVERVEGLVTVIAGADDLGATPGQFAQYSLSILNTGNGPTQYTISCESENRWIVKVGDSETSVLNLEPLSRLQFLPVPIRVRVPNDVLGFPSSGTIEDVSCTTQSVNDPSLFSIDEASVEVFESREFRTEIFSDSGISLGPLGLADDRSVLNGELVTTTLVITNEGNVPLQFTVNVQNSWPTQLIEGSNEVVNGDMSVDILAGNSISISVNTIVPLAANRGDSNTIIIRTTLQGSETLINGTKLIIEELASLDAESSGQIEVALGKSSVTQIKLHNIGNVPLDISLTMGSLPADWSGGFLSGNSFEMDMNREAYVSVGLDLPGHLPMGELSQIVSVIVEFTTPSGDTYFETIELSVLVVPSIWIVLESDLTSIEEVPSGQAAIFTVNVTNLGNTNSGAEIIISQSNDWNLLLSDNVVNDILPGESKIIQLSVKSTSSTVYGLSSVELSANATNFSPDDVEVTNSKIELQMSKERSSSSGGVSGLIESIGLPSWTLALLFLFSLAGVFVLGLRMRRNSQNLMSSEEELIPKGSALLSGTSTERRNAALDTSLGSGDTMTGGVSQDEIQAALAASGPPKLSIAPEGSAPLPLGGLPEGWTMDQWQSYGHLWWEQNQP